MKRFLILIAMLGRVCVSSAQTGLLIVAHGADSAWDSRVVATAAQVEWNGPARVAFLMGSDAANASLAGQAQALVAAGARRIVVVPLMVSSWGAHIREIEAAVATGTSAGGGMVMSGMGKGNALPAVPTRVTGALDSAVELGESLVEQWRRLPATDRQRPLVLVAHGPDTDSEAAKWVANITAACRALAMELPDQAVHVGLLRDDAPAPMRAAAVAQIRDTIVALARLHQDSALVMTVLISSGAINSVVVPRDLAGMPMHYVGAALTPSAALAHWIRRTALAVSW